MHQKKREDEVCNGVQLNNCKLYIKMHQKKREDEVCNGVQLNNCKLQIAIKEMDTKLLKIW